MSESPDDEGNRQKYDTGRMASRRRGEDYSYEHARHGPDYVQYSDGHVTALKPVREEDSGGCLSKPRRES